MRKTACLFLTFICLTFFYTKIDKNSHSTANGQYISEHVHLRLSQQVGDIQNMHKRASFSFNDDLDTENIVIFFKASQAENALAILSPFVEEFRRERELLKNGFYVSLGYGCSFTDIPCILSGKYEYLELSEDLIFTKKNQTVTIPKL